MAEVTATGICDALMAVHTRVPVDLSLWAELPEAPDRAIAFRDDSGVSRLVLERLEFRPKVSGMRSS
jgi:hypothetical protein